MLGSHLGRGRRRGDSGIDHRGHLTLPHGPQRDQHLERIETPGGLQRVADQIQHIVLGVAGGIEVIRVRGKHAEALPIAHQQRAATDRLEQQLVEVDGDRVGLFDTTQQLPVLSAEDQAATRAGIHVYPDAV
ncbi:Uncharacterised protein [Mycobacteroides abscessus]|nr:Uncharacterised protein [Mycobacteroides abscessus]